MTEFKSIEAMPKMALCCLERFPGSKFEKAALRLPKGTYRQIDFLAIPERLRRRVLRVAKDNGFTGNPDFVATAHMANGSGYAVCGYGR
jgi:hypothetical protein